MELDGFYGKALMFYPFYRLIIGVYKSDTKPRFSESLLIYNIAVVLTCNVTSPSPHINTWVVLTSMAEFQFIRLRSTGQSEDLTPETYAE